MTTYNITHTNLITGPLDPQHLASVEAPYAAAAIAASAEMEEASIPPDLADVIDHLASRTPCDWTWQEHADGVEIIHHRSGDRYRAQEAD